MFEFFLKREDAQKILELLEENSKHEGLINLFKVALKIEENNDLEKEKPAD